VFVREYARNAAIVLLEGIVLKTETRLKTKISLGASVMTDLEVASSVDNTVRVAVRASRQCRRVAGSRSLLLASQTVARRARSSHAEVVHGRGLLALLLAPESPGDDCQAADQDRSANTAYDSADDGFGLRCHGAAASAATAAFCEGWVDGGGCGFGCRDDAVACYDSGANCAVFCEECGCCVGFGGFTDDGGCDCGFGGECRGIDGAAADDDDGITVIFVCDRSDGGCGCAGC
jgi:hypothetical protein